jgi:two-component system cell cycle response regulator
MRITVTKGEEMGNKKSILIVDDDASMRRSLALILGRKGYDTETAETGREAMEEAQRRFFNVVLLDIKLPDVEGIELLAPLKSTHHDMAVIMITGHASTETAVRAMNTGASAYITKPLNMDEVLATVREALEKQCLIEEKRQAEEELARTVHDLEETVVELRVANQKILEQQKSVIEEERLKVLLQMAGATAHELNQPLMGLLANIDLMEMNEDNPQKLAHYMVEIKWAGERISDIVKKIQTLRHDETKPYIGETSIINLAQKIVILSLEASDEDFETLNAILEDHNQINLTRAKGIEEAIRVLKKGQFDLIFFDYFLPDGNGFNFLRRMEKEGLEIPIVVITGQGDEMIAAQVIQAGAYDYLTKDRVSDESISRVIVSTLEKARLKRETKQVQKKMAEIFTRDDLTGLYNRRYFMEALEREVSGATR